MPTPDMGLVLGSAIGPESLTPGARTAEEFTFDELWLSEDYFFTGGVAGAASALAATRELTVGIGVVSAVARHPALLAMELATLERQHPGRLRPGIGLGVPAWLSQMGIRPASSLAAVRECVTAVKALLAGERLDRADGIFTFDGVQLTYPLDTPPSIAMGVSGPRMLRLSGEVADATLLSVTAGADYVTWARQQIDEGRDAAGRTDPHRVTVFALFSVDEDGDRARAATRSQLAFYRSAGGANALTDVYGISDEIREMVARGGRDVLEREMPDQWVRDLTVAGTPEECAAQIQALCDAGADSVALFPAPADRAVELARIAGESVLPLVRG